MLQGVCDQRQVHSDRVTSRGSTDVSGWWFNIKAVAYKINAVKNIVYMCELIVVRAPMTSLITRAATFAVTAIILLRLA